MDESNVDSDLSMSPSQILERLQMLRQLQLLQRGKLQKQQLSYQDTSEISSSITEIVSHFSNSTSYNTFRSLLQSQHDSSNEVSPRQKSISLRKIEERDYIDGVSVLNLSQESEFVINSPTSVKSKNLSESGNAKSPRNCSIEKISNKQISLDEMPILTPKKNFEALVAEKLQTENFNKKDTDIPKENIFLDKGKRPFLKRGEGMLRFGLEKKDLVIQHTKTLPWHLKQHNTKFANKETKKNNKRLNSEKVNVEIKISQPAATISNIEKRDVKVKEIPEILHEQDVIGAPVEKNNCKTNSEQQDKNIIKLPKGKHPLQANKGKTWAAILTKEQDDFLRQLKQSDYYKNFNSPTKSAMSDISCESNIEINQNKETAEQRMFELLEQKVTNESFNIENSFINRFLRKTKLECSGESTPLVLQKCLSNNPVLLHINHDEENNNFGHESETCNSECTECVETCSTLSSCCSCVTIEPTNASSINYKDVTKRKFNQRGNDKKNKDNNKQKNTGIQSKKEKEECHNDKDMDVTDDIKTNMAEMNAKLVATSELLKERLNELEDEIETFRKENASLSKMREEIDLERQKFYEEKAAYEQKFNEEKILSEYYIAEEKEKLTKQKQLYERYVRDMRGRLNKKEKDEVISLKKEISDLKDEIKLKDAKSTSTIARLRNHLKIMEKEKKNIQDEMENLKKENRRIQHSNDVTRRLTNLKYLEQINKKLTGITNKESQSEVNLDPDVKYKAFEIERQSRGKKVQSKVRGVRPRAKSVPNLKVTSRYAKYFSQKDSLSEIERNKTLNLNESYTSPDDSIAQGDKVENLDHSYSTSNRSISDSDDENNLEKIYVERFQNSPPKSKRNTLSNSSDNGNINDEANNFFIQKSRSAYKTNSNEMNTTNMKDYTSSINYESSRNSSKENSNVSSESIKSHMSIGSRVSTGNPYNLSKSPISVTSNYSSSQKPTVINKSYYDDSRMNVTPEPSTSKSSLTRTNLNPTEIIKPDGSRELKFPNGNIKLISADGTYSKFIYYNGDVKENFYNEGRIKYFYAEKKTFHTTHADGLEVLEFADGQVEKRYKDGSTEIRLPNGSVRYFDPKNDHVREEWRFPDGSTLTVNANGEQRIVFANGQIEVHAKDHKRREFPDGTVKLVYNDGTAETRYASGRVRIKDKHGNLIMDSACR